MRRLLLAVPLLLSCATPRITNLNGPSAARDPAGYPIRATVEPRGTLIAGADAVVDGMPWPMAQTAGDTHEATVFPSPCVNNLAYHYEVRYQRKKIIGSGYSSTVRTVRSPEIGGHTLSLLGDAPDGCPDTFAKVIDVNSTEDAVDANPSDGTCATATGACTLRAAVMQANASAGHDIIRVPAGTYALTLNGTDTVDVPDPANGDLDITEGLTIQGVNPATVAIVGGPQRIFDIHVPVGSGFVQLQQLTLQDGSPNNGPGGAVFNRGETQVHRVRFTNNRLSSAVTCANFTALRICNRGGAIFNEGRLAVAQSTFSDNRTCTSTNCNGDSGQGGAISNLGANAQLTVDASTFDGNSARFVGAIMNRLGQAEILNSTFYGNTGGWASTLYTLGGTLEIRHATLAGSGDPFIRSVNGDEGAAVVRMQSSIVYNESSFAASVCQGTITSLGHNVMGNGSSLGTSLLGSCNFSNGVQTTDLFANFLMGSLGNNGGPTPTLPIVVVSPTSNFANIVDHGSGNCPSVDQRGFNRPLDGDDDGNAVCDPGAHELN